HGHVALDAAAAARVDRDGVLEALPGGDHLRGEDLVAAHPGGAEEPLELRGLVLVEPHGAQLLAQPLVLPLQPVGAALLARRVADRLQRVADRPDDGRRGPLHGAEHRRADSAQAAQRGVVPAAMVNGDHRERHDEQRREDHAGAPGVLHPPTSRFLVRPGPSPSGGVQCLGSGTSTCRSSSKSSTHLPVPSTTESSGLSTRWMGIPVSSRSRSSRFLSSAPPPVSAIPRSMMSPDSSGGHLSRVVFTASTTALTGSSMARRTSSAEITTVFGSPLTRSRPRISACGSSSPPG